LIKLETDIQIYLIKFSLALAVVKAVVVGDVVVTLN
jgi:hypothetical protein